MNVVLVILDSLQRNYVGAYGGKWVKTPNLDSLAKESCMFTNAYPESLPTLQVRRALHTGKKVYPFRENVTHKGDPVVQPGWGPIPEDSVTISEILQEKGYRTALITDTANMFKPGNNYHRGFDQYTLIRGFGNDPYVSGCLPGTRKTEDYYIPDIPIPGMKSSPRGKPSQQRIKIHQAYFRNSARRVSEEDYLGPQVFREAAKWLYQNQDAEHFFLVVDCFDIHEPWDPPNYYRKIYAPDEMDQDIILSTYSSSDVLNHRQLQRLRANYAGSITMVDRWLGYLLDSLKYMELNKDTLLIILSDHGHHLGEKNLVGKFPYPILPEVANLVLFIRDPRGNYKGKKVDEFVYDVDIAPTILRFLEIDTLQDMDGIDLAPIMRGKEHGHRDHVTTGWANNVMVRTEKFWYTARLDRSEELLFSMRDDPDFDHNLASLEKKVCKKMCDYALKDAGGSIPDYVKRWPKYSVFGGLKW